MLWISRKWDVFIQSPKFFFISTVTLAYTVFKIVLNNWDAWCFGDDKWVIFQSFEWLRDAPAWTVATIAALIVTSVCSWIRGMALNNKLKPKLTTSFSMDGECVKVDRFDDESQATYFRVKIETLGVVHIPDCSGALLKIVKDGKVISEGDNFQLVVAPGYDKREDHTKKDVYEGKPEYLDVLAVRRNSNFVFVSTERYAMPARFHTSPLFSLPGKYELHLLISAPNFTSIEHKLLFSWNDNWETATMTNLKKKRWYEWLLKKTSTLLFDGPRG